MIEMFFSIKFRSQLARTRPEVLSSIEGTVINSIRLSGASMRRENKMITAVFDERKIGFWLDVIFVIETVQRLLSENKRDLYGHSCVFAEALSSDAAEFLRKSLSRVDDSGAVWCAEDIGESIENFAVFKTIEHIEYENAAGAYRELERIKNDAGTARKRPLRKKIEAMLLVDKYRNTLLLGRGFTGKRDCLEWYCREENGVYTPLIFRFNAAGCPLNCFIDAFPESVEVLSARQNVPVPPLLAALYGPLAAGRLRAEVSAYAAKKASAFLALLFDAYVDLARARGLLPVVVLENIQNARPEARDLFLEEWARLSKRRRVTLLGSCSDAAPADRWRTVFPGVINCAVETGGGAADYAAHGESLWEVAYSCYLFGAYFPAAAFIPLFEEEGKNPEVLRKSLGLLVKHGIIRSIEDPSPAREGFPEKVEELLGERAAFIRSVARSRLLDWVAKGKLVPCFDLLEILAALGGENDPLLSLECIKSDVMNGACAAIERSTARGEFAGVVGADRAAPLLYIYNTLKSLIYGGEDDIRRAFKSAAPDPVPRDEYKARIRAIQALYHIGINDAAGATAHIKESMLLCQNAGERGGLSLVYRLFALVNLSKREINDAIDYFNYAVEYNEKGKDPGERTLGYYYSSAAHFVFGNISKARRVMALAVRSAAERGGADWACKSEFMLGRFFFESGAYAEAKELFENLAAAYGMEGRRDIHEVVSAWIERAALYMGARETGLKDIAGRDALLFRMEESYLREDYETTLEIADRVLADPPGDSFIFLEQPCWTSGYAQCELLPFSPRDFWTRVTRVWRALALSRLGGSGAREAVRTMQKIIRDERLNDTDPNLPFYFFANYRVACEAGLPEVDRNTAVSMAFKRLQRRAGRIDDVKIRQSYLTRQYWNNALFLTAKEHKLI